jgi:tetratricopeptide (TPR) repeat protein
MPPPSPPTPQSAAPWTVPRPLAGLPPVLLFFLISTAARAGQPDGYAEALALYQARQYSVAQEAFHRVARGQPDDVEVNFHLGRLALWFDDENSALDHLERALKAAPADARVLNALGDAYGLQAQKAPLLAKLGWARKCRTAYERAVELAPGNTAYRWSLLAFYQLAPGLVGGSEDKARREAEAIGRLDPAAGRIARVTLCLAAHDARGAFAEFEPVLRQNPDDYVALYQIGRCADVSGQQLDRGLRALRRCLELPAPAGDTMPRPVHVWYRVAGILTQQGDLTAARTQAAALDPDFRPEKDALKN